MRNLLRKIFMPVLGPLESGDDLYAYKPSHRYILLFVCFMFIGLATIALVLMPEGDMSYWFPVAIFGGGGMLGVVVGLLGNDRAIARIWGSR